MFSIVIPLFNESKNITELLNEISISLNDYKDYEIILVDDNSTDNTLDIINNFKDNKIKIFQNNKNKGQSFSISLGIKKSLYNTIITIDGDGQNDPYDIPKLLKYFNENKDYELVGGIRKKRKDSFIKIISSMIANYIRAKILKDDCKDTGCSLKVFNKKIFLDFPYFNGIHRFLPALFRGYGYKTKYIDVNHRNRKHGFSNYGTFSRLFQGIRDMIKVRKILNKNKKLK